MMARTLILPDFASNRADGGLNTPLAPYASGPQARDETDALEAYDAGYKSGWADCAAAEAEERSAVGAALAKNLSDASMTYEAARCDVLAALGPFFDDVASTLLPQMAAAALLPTVLAELGTMAEAQTLAQVEIHAAPSACASLERLGEVHQISGLTVRPESAFSEGQVSIHAGAEQRDLDMASAAARIAAAISDFSASVPDHHAQTLSQGAA